MIDTPAIGGSIGFWHLFAAAALFGIGYVLHEVMHMVPLELFGHEYEVNVGTLRSLSTWVSGPIIEVKPHGYPPRSHIVAMALAPLVFAMPPLVAWTIALTYPVVDIGTAFVLLVWFAVAIPSPQDWWLAVTYDPDHAVPTEVPA